MTTEENTRPPAFAEAKPRLRAGRKTIWRFWLLRLVLFFLVLVAAYAGAQLAVLGLPKRYPFLAGGIQNLLILAVVTAVNIALYALLVRWTEKRWPEELSLRTTPQFVAGTLVGFALFASTIAFIVCQHGAAVGGFSKLPGFETGAAIALMAGVCEELIFRGALFRILEEGLGTLVAIVITASFFGLAHAANPGANIVSTAAIAIEPGILLALAYTATRSLWLPIGIHFGWNFTEGGIFGAAVSGHDTHGLFATRFHGPDWLTGGAFGPESSVPAVAVCLVAATALLAITLRRGQWQPFRLRWTTPSMSWPAGVRATHSRASASE